MTTPGTYLTQPNSEERSMALIAHLSTIAALIISAGWLSFVGPLVVWFLYKDKSQFARQSAAGAFNFNLGMWVQLAEIMAKLSVDRDIRCIVLRGDPRRSSAAPAGERKDHGRLYRRRQTAPQNHQRLVHV